MFRGDEWADVYTGHLSSAEIRTANRSKEKLIEAQKGRKMWRTAYETGSVDPRDLVVDNLKDFCSFMEEANSIVDKEPTVVVVETKGDSDCWAKVREELDGVNYVKNDESSGVTVILLNVLVREEGKGNKAVFIDIKKIVDNELNGKPNLPTPFYDLLLKATITGELVIKHIKRLENSFGRMDGVLFITLQDLTNRWRNHNSNPHKTIWEFSIDPYFHEGLINNFHEVFGDRTFFRNPYEALADWSEITELRDSQLKHALNKIVFSGVLVKRILKYFTSWQLSLSAMGTVYPRCKAESRIDYRLKEAVRDDQRAIPWYREKIWPNYHQDRNGETCRNQMSNPATDRREAEEERRVFKTRKEPYLAEKRKYEVSDESDTDDADEVFRRNESEKQTSFERSTYVIRNLRSRPSRDKVAALMTTDKDDIFFASNVIIAFNDAKGKFVVNTILDHYAGMWPDERKERLINALAREGFFRRSKIFNPLSAARRINIGHPSANFFLQLGDVTADHISNFTKSLSQSAQQDVLTGLESYLELPLDERRAQMQTCEFYKREDLGHYLFDDNKIVPIVKAICAEGVVAPGDAFFRYRRPEYINSVIELGRQGTITSENAAITIAAHVGDDYEDKRDALVLTARWPSVTKILHEQWGVTGHPPQIQRCDPNLREDISCRQNFHPRERRKEICLIRNRNEFLDAKSNLSREELVVLVHRENRDPRSFSVVPSLIAFRAPDMDLFGFFPHDLDEELRSDVFKFLAEKILFVRDPKTVRRTLGLTKENFHHIHVGEVGMKYGFGRGNDALAGFVWDRRFCILTKDEWFRDPLSRAQEVHVAYELNLLDELVKKVGLSVVMRHLR